MPYKYWILHPNVWLRRPISIILYLKGVSGFNSCGSSDPDHAILVIADDHLTASNDNRAPNQVRVHGHHAHGFAPRRRMVLHFFCGKSRCGGSGNPGGRDFRSISEVPRGSGGSWSGRERSAGRRAFRETDELCGTWSRLAFEETPPASAVFLRAVRVCALKFSWRSRPENRISKHDLRPPGHRMVIGFRA